MKLPKFLKPLVARIAKFLTEVSTVSDEAAIPMLVPADVLVPAPEPTAPAPEVVLTPEVKVVPAKDFVEKLKAVLGAMGHELPEYFDDAVALAKKAL